MTQRYIKDYDKVLKVLNSCQTIEQLKVAGVVIAHLWIKWRDKLERERQTDLLILVQDLLDRMTAKKKELKNDCNLS